MSELTRLLEKLVSYPSITPQDAGCQDFILQYLTALGFQYQTFNQAQVSNCFARIGSGSPFLLFAGHTDVVEPGDSSQWISDPWKLTQRDGQLFGRGCADMKGALAGMLDAASQFLKKKPQFQGSLGFLITSGEEGDHFQDGTPYVMAQLAAMNALPDYCILGEPSSQQRTGDMIKIGRRGSLSAEMTVYGKQGHVAYPHLAYNPIHLAVPALAELTSISWDQDNDAFPPTTLQITSVKTDVDAGNVIPGTLSIKFNIRFSNEQTPQGLQHAIETIFQKHHLKTHFSWRLNGEPFLTKSGLLLDSCITAIQAICDIAPELSTSGGTSDGRFIAPYGVEIIELGLPNHSIHQVNEHINQTDLVILRDIYLQICEQIFFANCKNPYSSL